MRFWSGRRGGDIKSSSLIIFSYGLCCCEVSPNVLSISEVPSEAMNFGEGVARTRYTLLGDPSVSESEQPEGLRRVPSLDIIFLP